MSTALMFLTHIWSPALQAQIAELQALPQLDCWVLTDSRNPDLDVLKSSYKKVDVFSLEELADLPYLALATGGLKGNGQFPLLLFYLRHPTYEYYWLVEYDVRYTGRWATFFDHFWDCKDDFLTTHLRRREDEPGWYWWPSFGNTQPGLSIPDPLRSFNVIYRMSLKALAFLSIELRKGWFGHHEVLLATLLYSNLFSVADLGGDGWLTPNARINLTYSSSSADGGAMMDGTGTVCYRPIRTVVGALANKLYHPIK